jgi:hypothetical protein
MGSKPTRCMCKTEQLKKNPSRCSFVEWKVLCNLSFNKIGLRLNYLIPSSYNLLVIFFFPSNSDLLVYF